MNYLPFTLLAYFLNSISVTIDKVLLSKNDTDPALYVCYVSVFSLTALILLPFTHIPSIATFLLASTSTLLWTLGAYFMFKAIQIGNVSRVIPIIGTGIPLLLGTYALSQGIIDPIQVTAILLLITGLLVLTSPDWHGRITKREVLFEIIAITLFAISYIILRTTYLQDDFLTVFAWSRPILIVIGVAMLALPKTRALIKKPKGSLSLRTRTGALFLAGQMTGGASQLLLTFSISLADPSLVNSLQGVQYVFLIILSLALARRYPDLFKEGKNRFALPIKFIGISLIAIGVYLMAV